MKCASLRDCAPGLDSLQLFTRNACSPSISTSASNLQIWLDLALNDFKSKVAILVINIYLRIQIEMWHNLRMIVVGGSFLRENAVILADMHPFERQSMMKTGAIFPLTFHSNNGTYLFRFL
jgi:hypothetical protein